MQLGYVDLRFLAYRNLPRVLVESPLQYGLGLPRVGRRMHQAGGRGRPGVRGKRLWVGATLAATIGLVALLLWPTSMVGHAKTFLEARSDRDAGRLMRYASPREKEVTGLTRENLQRVLDEIEAPAMEGFRPQRRVMTELMAGGDEGTAYHPHATSQGQPLTYGAEVWRTEEGIYATVLLSILRSAWHAEGLKRTGKHLPGPGDVQRWQIDGIRRDRAKLESWGLKGIVSENTPNAELVTWDESEAWHRRLMAEFEAAAR